MYLYVKGQGFTDTKWIQIGVFSHCGEDGRTDLSACMHAADRPGTREPRRDCIFDCRVLGFTEMEG